MTYRVYSIFAFEKLKSIMKNRVSLWHWKIQLSIFKKLTNAQILKLCYMWLAVNTDILYVLMKLVYKKSYIDGFTYK